MRRRLFAALLALVGVVGATGCGVHITESRMFTVTGIVSIQPGGSQDALGERRLAGATVRIVGPTLDGTGITTIAYTSTDAVGQYSLVIPHTAVASTSNRVYPWSVEVTGQVAVNDVLQPVRLSAAFVRQGNELIDRPVTVASTIVSRNIQPWMRLEPGAPEPDAPAYQTAQAFAEGRAAAGTNEAIRLLEADVDALLADPPAGLTVGMSMLTDLNAATAAVCGALTDGLAIVAGGSEVATTASAGTLSLHVGQTADLTLRAANDGRAMGWGLDVANSDEPATGAGVPATVLSMARTGATTLRLTAKKAGSARVWATLGAAQQAVQLAVTVTP